MRHLVRGLIVLLVGLVTSAIGVLAALTLTPPGRTLLSRNVSNLLGTLLRGDVQVGNIGGSFLRDLVLRDVVVRDTAGVLLASLPRARLTYLIPNLLSKRFILETLVVDEPVINLVRHASGRWNYEEVLRLNEGPPGGVPDLIEFRNLRIDRGTLSLAFPWPGTDKAGAVRTAAVAAARAEGRMIQDTPEGTQKVIAFSDLTALVRRLRISTPARDPLLVVIDTLRVDVSDPQVRLRQLEGVIDAQGDSLRFALTRAELPGTVAWAEGLVSWPRDTVMFDFRADATELDLKDLRFISPDFPDMQGRARVTADAKSGAVTEYDVRDMALADGPERLQGNLVAVVDVRRGLGVRGARLQLTNFNLDKVRPFVDSLPFTGTITGPVAADGLLTNIIASGDIAFTDLGLATRPVSRFDFDGRFETGAEGLVFRGVSVRSSDIDLGTVRRLAPAVTVDGRIRAVGTLDGPLDNTTFIGTARHQDGDRPESVLAGTTRLDTRGTPVRVAADLTLAPLSFEGIRRSFPAIPSRGDLQGRVRLEGPVDRLFVDADVQGEVGAIRGGGTVTILPPRWAADSLTLTYRDLDLEALLGRYGPTRLNGTLTASGAIDTLVAPQGTLGIALGQSTARGLSIDSLDLVARVVDSLITIDRMAGSASGLQLTGAGTLGWARPHSGTLSLSLVADSLMALDSAAQALTGFTRDTLPDWRELNGVLRLDATLAGSLDTLEADFTGSLDAFAFNHFRASQATVSGLWRGGARPTLDLDLRIDSLQYKTQYARRIGLVLLGPADSTRWVFSSAISGSIGVAGSGTFLTDSTGRVFALDGLGLNLPSRAWQLVSPGALTLSDSVIAVTPIEFSASDGSGFLRVQGRAPWETPGDMTLEALGISVRDVYALAQLDTVGSGGWMGFNLQLAGTRYDPEMGGTITVEDLTVGDTQGPFVQGVLRYMDRRLDGGLLLYRTGDPVLQIRYSLPLDLAFTAVKERQVDGPLSVQAIADSVDLSVLEAVVPSIRQVSGTMNADLKVVGTWADPVLGGDLDLMQGALYATPLGVRFTGINGRFLFEDDSIIVRKLDVQSERGSLAVTGDIKLEGLNRPVLDLSAKLTQFTAIEQRDFLSLTASGDLGISGPFDRLVVTGTMTADRGALYFADLLTKRIIDLDDPDNLAFLDTTLIRRRKLGSDLSSRIIQSVEVDDLRLNIGNDFWLRSAEANIQLGGSVQANRADGVYRVDGTMRAVRGRYRLSPVPGFSRDFEVTKGNVRFFGTSDMNAQLDIEARYTVRTNRNAELPIIALITGTLQEPKLKLESTQRPPLSELDIASYLVTGAPASEALAQGQSILVTNVSNYVLSAGASALEATMQSDLGMSMFQIRTINSPGANASALGSAIALDAGWQLSKAFFLRFNAGFCTTGPSAATFDYRNFGAAIEWRMNAWWRLQGVMEPVLRNCGVTAVGSSVSSNLRYQLGADLLWEREF